jgi:hypothetical protein
MNYMGILKAPFPSQTNQHRNANIDCRFENAPHTAGKNPHQRRANSPYKIKILF